MDSKHVSLSGTPRRMRSASVSIRRGNCRGRETRPPLRNNPKHTRQMLLVTRDTGVRVCQCVRTCVRACVSVFSLSMREIGDLPGRCKRRAVYRRGPR